MLLALLPALLYGIASPAARAQTYSRGQSISPAFEGWERDEDGQRYFLFGYMNRNWLEEIDVPIGPENYLSPGAADQGQPTHFLPRRNRFVFRVAVPAGFSDTDEMVWTLTVRGETERAHATLASDYFVDNLVKASEQGAIGAGTSNPVIRSNQGPVLELEGETKRKVRVGEPLELTAVATDDGIPPRRNQVPIDPTLIAAARGSRPLTQDPRWLPHQHLTVGSATGLRLSWYVYRGSGEVSFDPLQTKVWEDTRTGANSPWAPLWEVPAVPEDGRWVVKATFHEPGEYTLRCLASDGALDATGEVHVTVTE